MLRRVAASIFVLDNGENAIVISPGANRTLTSDDVRNRLSDMKEGDIVLCQLETPIETVKAALVLAKKGGATTILDPAPADNFQADLLAHADFVTPNETEIQSILRLDSFEITEKSELENTTIGLRKLNSSNVILKLGEAGCYYSDGNTSEMIPGHSVDVVDTTAAGDTFNGALAAKLAEGNQVRDSLVFANAAAAISVTGAGAQPSIPDFSEVEAFINENSIEAI